MNPISAMAEQFLKGSMNEAQWAKCSQILMRQYEEAMITWAIVKMGKDRVRLFELAWEDFLANLLLNHDLLEALESGTLWTRLEKAHFTIPKTVKRRTKYPEAFEKVNPDQFLEQYENVLSIVAPIKRKRYRNDAALRLALKSHLVGFPEGQLKKYYKLNASDLALEYVAWKFKIQLGRESVKKLVGLARDPRKILQKVAKDVENRLNDAMSIS